MCWWEYIYVGKFFVNNYIYYVLRQVTNPQLGYWTYRIISCLQHVSDWIFFLPGAWNEEYKRMTNGHGDDQRTFKRWPCSWNYVHMAEVCKYVHFSYPFIRKWAKTYIYAFTHISMQRYAQKKQR
jgi:hypothetical protein